MIDGFKNAPKNMRSHMETIVVTKETLQQMKRPPFQRELRVTKKVEEIAAELKADSGIISGVITIGVLDDVRYLVDGQHRLKAFDISGLPEGIADFRVVEFETMADMADAYFKLNSPIATFRADDKLRALEAGVKPLATIRQRCPFVGYEQIRRNPATSPILSMSMLLRCWKAGTNDSPSGSGGPRATDLALALSDEEANSIVQFLEVAMSAWGRDPQYARLWSTLNFTMCIWLWRRVVLTKFSQRTTQLTTSQFGKCLSSLSADEKYIDWLLNRALSDHSRSPAYNKVKSIFGTRIIAEGWSKKPMLPQPQWATSVNAKYA